MEGGLVVGAAVGAAVVGPAVVGPGVVGASVVGGDVVGAGVVSNGGRSLRTSTTTWLTWRSVGSRLSTSADTCVVLTATSGTFLSTSAKV